METFTYPGTSSSHTMTSVLSRQHAETIADAFERAGVDSPFSTDYDSKRAPGEEIPRAYLKHCALVAAVAELPDMWGCDVHHVLAERRKARQFAKLRSEQARVAHLGIRAYLLAMPETHNLRAPEVRDLTDLAKLAMRDNLGNGKPVYKPAPGCQARLKLRDAVTFWSEQASYADHTRYAVPVEMGEGADMAVCRANLGTFCAALRTHNGFAGSGCTWTAELITSPEGNFVVMDCRASISD